MKRKAKVVNYVYLGEKILIFIVFWI